MTRRLSFVLQWGPRGGSLLGGVSTPGVTLTVHLPPGRPGWSGPKGVRLVREWFRPTRVARTAHSKWLTARAVVNRPGRWATRGEISPAGVSYLGWPPPHPLYDYSRWAFPVRGTLSFLPGWSPALTLEDHLVRPKHV